MDLEKLRILGESAKYDICASSSCRISGNIDIFRQNSPVDRIGNLATGGICHSYTPDGRCVSLFKVLLSNYCEKNCLYCPNRKDSGVRRAKFGKDELARIFIDLYSGNFVEGLFLSSAVHCSVDHAMTEMLDVCTIVRTRYRFTGYIHLKILPGVSDAHVESAMKIATRVSLNLEAPNADYLKVIAPEKDFHGEIISRLEAINRNIQNGNRPNAGYTTQLIVGAAGEGDRDIMRTVGYLYRKKNLRRAYFSAFIPQSGTPFAGNSEIPLTRENRLYQADWLLRFYDFDVKDLPFGPDGNLPLDKDPKRAWAEAHPELFPIEINRVSYDELLRVPGIGQISARRIVTARHECRITDVAMLKRMGVVLKNALPFILIDGKSRLPRADTVQRTLFA
ncbi:MAG: putative DNA modification/repair radical SAM protein [Spirochaetota bacterium]